MRATNATIAPTTPPTTALMVAELFEDVFDTEEQSKSEEMWVV